MPVGQVAAEIEGVSGPNCNVSKFGESAFMDGWGGSKSNSKSAIHNREWELSQ